MRCSTAPRASAPKAARLSLEVKSALYDLETRPAVVNYIYGLGGSDVRLELMERVYTDLSDIASGTAVPAGLTYLGTR